MWPMPLNFSYIDAMKSEFVNIHRTFLVKLKLLMVDTVSYAKNFKFCLINVTFLQV
jgi:hypothetical protein